MPDKDTQEILRKYRKVLGKHIDEDSLGQVQPEEIKEFSREYETFRREMFSMQKTKYEIWCQKAERIFRVKAPPQQTKDLEEAIETAHLEITSDGAASFAALTGFLLLFFAFLLALLLNIPLLLTLFSSSGDSATLHFFPPLFIILLGLLAMRYLVKIPIFMAAQWRLKASNQMVLCILYVVIYMRHTSNLEHAVKFAAEHIGPPLSLDLRKVFWDIETRKYSTIKESLDNYLIKWRQHNLEFVTAFNLIQSSLYEPSDERRKTLLDKALNTILDGTYEKMLHYAQELKSPITTLHMLGVILPILGLVVFPLIGSFLGGLVKWYHLAFLYNLILPALVFFLGLNILSKRPTGYGDSEFTKRLFNQAHASFFLSFLIFVTFFTIAIFPLVIHWIAPQTDIVIGTFQFLGYIESTSGSSLGPFGLGALLLSFMLPLGAAFAISLYYKMKTRKLITLRNETKLLEKEFSAGLFQLGNRIGDGIPTELAFSRVAEILSGTPTGIFFSIVDKNMRSLGQSLEEAIFNPKNGAILSYPSPLIESSMEVLIESTKKGPLIVAQSLTSIANYVERIHKVNERLRDLLSEVVSSMKAQIKFLTPAIAGIVVGISSMIVTIIIKLNTSITSAIEEGADLQLQGGIQNLVSILSPDGIIPGYYFQLVVGVYVVQLALILTYMQNGIENGTDQLNQKYLMGRYVFSSTLLYTIIAVIVVILFTALAQGVLNAGAFA